MRSGFVLLLLGAVATAKVFNRCEWARKLKDSGMHNYHGVSLANWVCLTQWESHFNTAVTHRNTDGSTDYGIFQINNRWWCDDGSTRSKNACKISCRALLSNDVTAAINCAKRVVRDPQGISAWYAWRSRCQGQDLSSYLAGCGL